MWASLPRGRGLLGFPLGQPPTAQPLQMLNKEVPGSGVRPRLATGAEGFVGNVLGRLAVAWWGQGRWGGGRICMRLSGLVAVSEGHVGQEAFGPGSGLQMSAVM